MQIGFIGLGKLGLPCAEAMATQYSVTGYDIYERTSDTVKISPTLEGAVKGKDIVFVAVQTPHDPIYDGSQPITHLPKRPASWAPTMLISVLGSVMRRRSLVCLKR